MELDKHGEVSDCCPSLSHATHWWSDHFVGKPFWGNLTTTYERVQSNFLSVSFREDAFVLVILTAPSCRVQTASFTFQFASGDLFPFKHALIAYTTKNVERVLWHYWIIIVMIPEEVDGLKYKTKISNNHSNSTSPRFSPSIRAEWLPNCIALFLRPLASLRPSLFAASLRSILSPTPISNRGSSL